MLHTSVPHTGSELSEPAAPPRAQAIKHAAAATSALIAKHRYITRAHSDREFFDDDDVAMTSCNGAIE
jgi:hypothetical protein